MRLEQRLVLIPQVAFVGGVLDVVTDVVVHSMGCCAVSRIKNLEGHCKKLKFRAANMRSGVNHLSSDGPIRDSDRIIT